MIKRTIASVIENGKITAYELKWNPKVKVKAPELFTKKYHADFRVIHSENFRSFI